MTDDCASKEIGKTDDDGKLFIKECLDGNNTHGFDIDAIHLVNENGKKIYYLFEYLRCQCKYLDPYKSDPSYYPFNWKKFCSLFEVANKLNGKLILVNYGTEESGKDKVRVMEVDYIDYKVLKDYVNTNYSKRPKHLKYIHYGKEKRFTFAEYSAWLKNINAESCLANFNM